MLLLALGLVTAVVGTIPAGAAEATVGLGTADSFAVLGASTVTNTGPSVISSDLGVSPGTAVTGFPPGVVNSGTIHATDAVAAQAQLDLTAAYNDAAGRSASAAVTADLGGQTLVAGVYSGPTLALTGSLTLDAQGDPDAVFIFRAGSTLVTGTTSAVALTNGAQACNVFWQVGSSATLGTRSVFVGSVLALTSVTANTGASVVGRLLARNGAVTLDSNSITRPACAITTTTTTTASTSSSTSSSTISTTTSTTGTTASTSTTLAPPGVDTGDDDAPTTGGLPGTSGGNTGVTPSGATPSGATPTGATSTAGTPTAGTPTGSVPSLPATGLGISLLTATGMLAVAVGAVVLLAARRKTLSDLDP